jgi:glutathione S-transferase
MRFELPPGQERMAGYGSFPIVMDVLEKAVSCSDFVAGDRFTAADVYCGSQIGFGLRFGSIEKRPAFERYWERISTRPTAVRAAQV